MEEFLEKITSRKFLLSLAAFLGSFGTGVAGICSGNDAMIIVGSICAVLSASIYAACEAAVDSAAASAVITTTNTTVSASTTAKDVVQDALKKE